MGLILITGVEVWEGRARFEKHDLPGVGRLEKIIGKLDIRGKNIDDVRNRIQVVEAQASRRARPHFRGSFLTKARARTSVRLTINLTLYI